MIVREGGATGAIGALMTGATGGSLIVTLFIGTGWMWPVEVLTALMFTRHGYGKRFVDCSEDADYWYFVVLAWLPVYFVVYLLPRMMVGRS